MNTNFKLGCWLALVVMATFPGCKGSPDCQPKTVNVSIACPADASIAKRFHLSVSKANGSAESLADLDAVCPITITTLRFAQYVPGTSVKITAVPVFESNIEGKAIFAEVTLAEGCSIVSQSDFKGANENAAVVDAGTTDSLKPSLCTSGGKQCNDGTPEICMDGIWVSTGKQCASICNEGVCTGDCKPRSRQCSMNGTPQLCDDAGKWNDQDACSTTCIDGLCAGCTADAKTCNGDYPMTCDASGQWSKGPICQYICGTAQGKCTGECKPNGKRCNPLATNSAQVCSESAQWESKTSCANGCQSGVCNQCKPNATSCTGIKLTTCKPDGSAEITDDCPANSVCSNGACKACTAGGACAPDDRCHVGTYSCSTGSAVCIDAGNAANGTSCGAQQSCSQGKKTLAAVCNSGACIATPVACQHGCNSAGTDCAVCPAGSNPSNEAWTSNFGTTWANAFGDPLVDTANARLLLTRDDVVTRIAGFTGGYVMAFEANMVGNAALSTFVYTVPNEASPTLRRSGNDIELGGSTYGPSESWTTTSPSGFSGNKLVGTLTAKVTFFAKAQSKQSAVKVEAGAAVYRSGWSTPYTWANTNVGRMQFVGMNNASGTGGPDDRIYVGPLSGCTGLTDAEVETWFNQ
jgi:hypothetical protein